MVFFIKPWAFSFLVKYGKESRLRVAEIFKSCLLVTLLSESNAGKGKWSAIRMRPLELKSLLRRSS